MSVLNVEPDTSTIYHTRSVAGGISTPFRSPFWPTTASPNAADTSASTAATVGRGAIRMMMLGPHDTPPANQFFATAFSDHSSSLSLAASQPRGTSFIDATTADALATPLNLPQLMGQTRLVNAKMSQIRSELEAVIDKVWAPNSSGSHHGALKGDAVLHDEEGIASVVMREPTCKGPLELTEALDKVGRLVGSVGHARRLLAQAIERPLSDFKSQVATSLQRRGAHGGASGMTAQGALSMREQVAISFGEEEIRLIKQELKKLLGQLTMVETRLLRVLGVGGADEDKRTDASAMGDSGVAVEGTKPAPQYVLRRRQEVDPAAIRRDVEQTMRCDPRFAQLMGVRGLASASFTVAGASAKVLTDECGWSPKRLVYKSQFNYELEHVEALLAKEYAKQADIALGRDPSTAPDLPVADDNACSSLDAPPLAKEERVGADMPTATVVEEDAAAGVGIEPPPNGVDDAMSDLVDAVGCLSPMAASFVCTPTSEVDDGNHDSLHFDASAAAAPHHNRPPTDAGNRDDADTTTDATAIEPSLPLPVAPPPAMPEPTHFADRLRTWVREFLLSGACQWVACEDDNTHATFFFNLATGERVDNLEDYYADVVAEAIARDLLAEGEHNDVGWIVVPSGASGYDDNGSDYYCHQLSGEVTWNLVEWVKEH